MLNWSPTTAILLWCSSRTTSSRNILRTKRTWGKHIQSNRDLSDLEHFSSSYRCVNYPKQATDCQARIKHNVECGEILMRSEHNHPADPNVFETFLGSAVKVRKFTRKTPRIETATTSCDKAPRKSSTTLDLVPETNDCTSTMDQLRDCEANSTPIKIKMEKK